MFCMWLSYEEWSLTICCTNLVTTLNPLSASCVCPSFLRAPRTSIHPRPRESPLIPSAIKRQQPASRSKTTTTVVYNSTLQAKPPIPLTVHDLDNLRGKTSLSGDQVKNGAHDPRRPVYPRTAQETKARTPSHPARCLSRKHRIDFPLFFHLQQRQCRDVTPS
jgi:hypothetical protein